MKLSPTFEADFDRSYARSFAAGDLRPLHEWAPDNVTVGTWSPWPGKLSFDHTPWLIHPLKAARVPTCHRETLVAAAAGGKSTVGELHLAWTIPNDPGFSCWFTPTEQTTKEFAETRIGPFLQHCPAVVNLLPGDRHKKRQESIIFPHMSFLMLPANISSTQSKHIRYLYCDETWLYAPGLLAQMHKRTTKFAHNRKIFEFSTGSILGDETDQAFNAGTKREWQLKCPKCSQFHVPFFSPTRLDEPGGVRWSPGAKQQTGVYDFNIVRKSAFYECPHCREHFEPSEANQYRLNKDGAYTGPEEIQPHESYHWGAIVSDFRLIGDFAVEFLQARAALRRGTTELLQEFTQKREALPWNVAVLDDEPTNLIESTYSLGDPWPIATHRFLTVDVQKGCLWAVIRDWAPGPESRLVWAGKVLTFDELRLLQLDNGVPDVFVFLDSGYATDTVYGQCCRFDWNATKGEEAKNGFIWTDEKTKLSYHVPVIESNGDGVPLHVPIDAKFSSCQLYRISEHSTSESLHLFRRNVAKGWTLPKNPPADHTAQMSARVRRAHQDKKTGQTIYEWVTIATCGEHLWDCERMQISAAFLAELLEGKPMKAIEEEKEVVTE